MGKDGTGRKKGNKKQGERKLAPEYFLKLAPVIIIIIIIIIDLYSAVRS